MSPEILTPQPSPRETLTPCGRIPNTRLRNPKHELVAHAYVNGKQGREAGLEAGYKDGPGLKGNIARLRQLPIMQERIEEIARRAVDLAEIYDAWLLEDCKLFERASLGHFFARNEEGGLDLKNGLPQLNFQHATDSQLRTLKSLRWTKHGPAIEVFDPRDALDKLMRHRGLLKDKLALTDPTGEAPARLYIIAERPMSEDEWEKRHAPPLVVSD